MKALFWIGLLLLILGIVSLLVPIPGKERHGVNVGGVSVGIETEHDEKLSPIVGAAMILGGAGLMAVGKKKG